MNKPKSMLNLFDFEKSMNCTLETSAIDYYQSGALDEHTLKENISAFQRIQFLPRVLKNVSHVNTNTTFAGQQLNTPIIFSPTAFLGMAHEDGELAVARAAKNTETIMICSTLSNYPIEEITASTQASVWFQLYAYKDRQATLSLIQRAKHAGCKALVLTVDAPFLGRREQDIRNQFQLPSHLNIANLFSNDHSSLPSKDGHSGLAHYFENLIDKSLTWRDIDWLKRESDMPVYLKGILHPRDAQLAVEHGIDGIIVSNHGGRQLDGSISSIDALPKISRAVNKQIPIILDGGIRRGSDVLKALALGAETVGIGRPVIWGLSHSGQEGVESIVNILTSELNLAMALVGCPDIQSISSDILV